MTLQLAAAVMPAQVRSQDVDNVTMMIMLQEARMTTAGVRRMTKSLPSTRPSGRSKTETQSPKCPLRALTAATSSQSSFRSVRPLTNESLFSCASSYFD